VRHVHGRWRWRDEAARAGSETSAHVRRWWVHRGLGRDKVAVGRDRGGGLRPGNGTLKVLAGAGTTALAASSASAATAAGTAATTSVVVAAVGAGNPVELGVRLAPVGIGGASGAGRPVVTDIPLPRLSLDSGGPGRCASGPGEEPNRQGLLLGKLGISDAVRGRGGAEAVIRVNGRATRIGLGRHG
jgi:hypothetical protein